MNTNSFNPYSAWKMAIDPIATGKAWRHKRRELSLSQDDLALIFELAEMDIAMSKSAISAVENGRHTPSIHHAFFFAELCGYPVEELVVTYRRSREADGRDQLPPLIIGALSIVGVRNKYPKSAARVKALTAFLQGAGKDSVSEAIKIVCSADIILAASGYFARMHF